MKSSELKAGGSNPERKWSEEVEKEILKSKFKSGRSRGKRNESIIYCYEARLEEGILKRVTTFGLETSISDCCADMALFSDSKLHAAAWQIWTDLECNTYFAQSLGINQGDFRFS